MTDNSVILSESRTLAEIRQDPATWSMAALGWIQSKRSANTRRNYSRAMQNFFDYIGKAPWAVAGSDAIQWQAELRRRGLTESTINLYLSALSSYYRYCCNRYYILDPATDQEEPLATSNPANRPERTRIKPYGRAVCLTMEQTEALLMGIERGTNTGRRDYAMIVGYILTGARDSELRCLKWGDLVIQNNQVVWLWRGKGGKTQLVQYPWPAYYLITDYLRLSDRLDTIGADDYIFIPHSDCAKHFPTVDDLPPPGKAPISNSRINSIVKTYASWAGIKGRISVHSLRHTAAMLRRDHTTDVQDLQRFLHHSNLNATQIYIDHLTTHTDTIALKVAAQLGIE